MTCFRVSTSEHLVVVYDLQVEYYDLTSSLFPFIVAEEDVCSEIRMLESSLEAFEGSPEVGYGSRNVAVEFLHEVGWLLHHSHLKTRLKSKNHTMPKFPFGRFRWLMEFSMENDWCAVVKKLFGILCDGVVDAEGHSSIEAATSALDLLHVAVGRNSRPTHGRILTNDAGSDLKQHSYESQNRFPFTPNAVGVGGLTPLHIAASTSGSEHVLDALTDDPLLIGIEAWKTDLDSSGLTPNDYASLQCYYSYIRLIQRKALKKYGGGRERVIVDVPSYSKSKPSEGLGPTKSLGLESRSTGQKSLQTDCKLCNQKLVRRVTKTSQITRPAMLWEKLPYGRSCPT